jgi:hypothetical protein
MATYTVDLSPALVNLASEGSLDTVKDANGNSIQREYFGVWVVNGSDRKMVGIVKDGQTFDDTIITSPADYPFIS